MPANGNAGALEVGVDGRIVRFTNLDRVLWPETGTTKRDLVDYDLRISPVLLPQLHRRAVMLWRFPEGVERPGWFQANCRGRPDWIPVHEIVGRRGETLTYCLVEEPAALAWLANLGTIELHPFLWTIDRPAEPTALVLDLDPGPPASLVECCRVALRAREVLSSLGLPSVPKTSGGLGLHVVVPLAPGASFEVTKAFARAMARRLARELPELVVLGSARAQRAGRIFVDWIQNDANRQTVAAYSLRATPIPSVSTPVTWEEIEACARTGFEPDLRFGPSDVLARVDRLGDLFAPALAPGAALPDVDALTD